MRHLLTLLLLAASAFGQTATISDTIRTPFGGTFSGTVTVSLNSPALAQPLYSGNVTLSGWTQAVTVTAGVFALTLYTNDLITPGGTSYTATYAPTSGSGWKETWIVPTGATTIREIRSTTVPSPSVRFNPSQITQAGATFGQGLRWNGSIWAPAAVLTDPMTTTGDLITRSGIDAVRVGIGSTGQVLTVSGGLPVWASGITGNASTATALAADGANCSAGSFPLGVDASGAAQNCTALPTTISGTANQITASAATGSVVLSLPSAVSGLTSVAATTFTGALTGNASTATALAANPTDCGAGQFANAIAASGNLTCAAVTLADVSGAVGGASTLTTPGSIPFVTSAGVLGQSANLFWDNANGRLGVGTNAPNNPLQVVSTATSAHSIFVSAPATNSAGPGVGFASNNGANTGLLQLDNSGNLVLRQAQSSMFFDFASQLNFRANAGVTQLMRLLSNGNLLLGTTTDDGTNRLQVAGSARFATTANGTPAFVSLSATGTGSDAAVDTVGSGAYINLRSTLAGPYAGTQINKSTNTVLWFTGTQGLDSYGWFTGSSFMRLASLTTGGTLALYNEIPTIGSTSLVVRAGAGQGGNNLTTWQNSGGTEVARVNAGGGFAAQEFFNLTNTFYQNGVNVDVGSGGIYRFASIASQGGTKDLSLSRASANTLQVGDGSANSNGTILARIYTWANGTEGTCDATLRGQVVMVQGGAGVADTFRVCRKDAANAYAWTALY